MVDGRKPPSNSGLIPDAEGRVSFNQPGQQRTATSPLDDRFSTISTAPISSAPLKSAKPDKAEGGQNQPAKLDATKTSYEDKAKEALATAEAKEAEALKKFEPQQKDGLSPQQIRDLEGQKSFIIREAQNGTYQGSAWSSLAEINRKLKLPEADTCGQDITPPKRGE